MESQILATAKYATDQEDGTSTTIRRRRFHEYTEASEICEGKRRKKLEIPYAFLRKDEQQVGQVMIIIEVTHEMDEMPGCQRVCRM